MKVGEFYQQGDVIVERVEGIPGGEKVEPSKRGFVLAEGEVTGHAHCIAEIKSATMIKTKDGKVYLSVRTATPLKHDEHHIIIIEPGEYEVRKVQEYDHFEEAAREVRD